MFRCKIGFYAEGSVSTGHTFELSAHQNGELIPDFSFQAPVTITIKYSDLDVMVVSDESQLALYRWTGTEWQEANQTCDPVPPSELDTTNNILQVGICSSGLLNMLVPTNFVFFPITLR